MPPLTKLGSNFQRSVKSRHEKRTTEEMCSKNVRSRVARCQQDRQHGRALKKIRENKLRLKKDQKMCSQTVFSNEKAYNSRGIRTTRDYGRVTRTGESPKSAMRTALLAGLGVARDPRETDTWRDDTWTSGCGGAARKLVLSRPSNDRELSV